MIIRYLLSILLVCSFSLGGVACADSDNQNDHVGMAEIYIEECKSQASPKWDTGVTTTMVEGNILYRDCLLRAMSEKINETIIDEDIRREALEDIESAYHGVFGAYSAANNFNKECAPTCGSIHRITPAGPANAVLEAYLKHLEALKTAYGQ